MSAAVAQSAGDHTDERSTEDVFRLVSAELERISSLLGPIETVFCELAREDEPSGKDCAALQNFDLVVQSLEAIEVFVSALATCSHSSGKIDVARALDVVRLGAMRARLAGSAGESAEAEEVELF